MEVVIPFLVFLLLVYFLCLIKVWGIRIKREKKFYEPIKKQIKKISEAIDNANNK